MAGAESLETKRAEVTAKLESLRIAPDVAALVTQADAAVAGFKSEVAELEEQISELDRAIGAKARSRRAEAERDRQDQRTAQRQQLVEEEEVRLQAVADAEAAARALAKAINDLLASNARLGALARALSANGKMPSVLGESELVSRTAGRIAGLMAVAIKGRPYQFGSIVWQGGSLYPENQVWRNAEEALIARHLLQPLLSQEKGKTNG
jgi:DNA repair exonuclease SbcCD ATPase subunit